MANTISMSVPANPQPASPQPVKRRTFGELLGSDLRALPVVIGLVALWIFFAFQSDVFLTSQNLSNLLLQSTVVGVMRATVPATAGAATDVPLRFRTWALDRCCEELPYGPVSAL